MKLFNYFTKFEIFLWLISVFAIVFSFLLPTEKNFLTLISSLLGVTALIFIAKGNVIGQVIIIIFSVFYGIVSFYFRYYGEMITYLCMSAPAAAVSVATWLRNPSGKKHEVRIGKLGKSSAFLIILLTLCVTLAFYFILRALGTSNLFVSTVSVATSFLAACFLICRIPYYAIAYAANDIILIILWLLASLDDVSYIPMIVCFIMFLLNDCYGFYSWLRIQKRQKKQENTVTD